jgi:hypothetical protein
MKEVEVPMSLIEKVREYFFPHIDTLPAGMYQYQSPPEVTPPYRLHLRLEADGSGILIINASTVLHLNQSAAEYAYHVVKDTSPMKAARVVSHRFRVKEERAYLDYLAMKQKIETLATTPDVDPVSFLELERREPYATKLSAPYRLECALTYRDPEAGGSKIAPIERVKRELTFEEWKIILDKAWNAGIPHVIFTGGEPTIRPDLPDLIAYAQNLGQVTGLLTEGLRLSEPKFLHLVLQNGLDHILFLLDPSSEQSWDALRDTLHEDIFVTVHLTITHENQAQLHKYLDILQVMEVKSLSLSVEDSSLKEVMHAGQQTAAEHGITLRWDLPVPYSHLHPVALELADQEIHTEGAGVAWLYVEPDGDVLPQQGRYEEILGNMLTDDWEKIWKNTNSASVE